MESLREQSDLEGLLYQETSQPAPPLALKQGVNLESSLPETAPINVDTLSEPEQLEEGQTEQLMTETGESESENTLQAGAEGPASAGSAPADQTSQLEETRMILSSGALDIAARRSLLLGRTKQRYVCQVCNRECPSKHKLKRHLSTHSQDRPFSCHVCGKCFKWTEYLQKHMRQQHPGVAVQDVTSANGTVLLTPSTNSSSSPPPSSPTHTLQHSATSSVSVSTDHMDVTMETMGTSVDHDALDDSSVFVQHDSATAQEDPNNPPSHPSPSPDVLSQPQSIPPPEMVPVQPTPPDPLPDQPVQTASEVVAQLSQFGISLPVSSAALAGFNPETTALQQSTATLGQQISSYSMIVNNTQPIAQMNDVLSSMETCLFNGHQETPHGVPNYHHGQQLDAADLAAAFQQQSLPPPHEIVQPTTAMAAPMYSDATSTAAYSTNTPTATPSTIIIREDMNSGEERPAKRPRKESIDIGIQCEVGHETLVALREEEEQAQAEEGGDTYTPTGLEIGADALHVTNDSNQQILLLQQGGFHEGGERQYATETEGGVLMPSNGSVSAEALLSPQDPLRDDKVVHKYPCEVDNCAKAYIHRKDLIRHMKIRHGVSPKKLEPVAMETPEKPYICSVGFCGRSYFHMKDLRRHQRQCHTVGLSAFEDTLPDSMLDTGVESKSQLRYPCDFPGCIRSYVHKKDLVRHKRLYHKDSSTKPSVPFPIRYSETELKRIRQEVKVEIDRMVDKIRLDSTGSTASTASGGEDPPNSAPAMETEVNESELASSVSTAQVMESLNNASMSSATGRFHPSSLISSVANAIIGTVPLSSTSTVVTHSREATAVSNLPLASDLLALQEAVSQEQQQQILQSLSEAPAQLVSKVSTPQQQQLVLGTSSGIYSTTGYNIGGTFTPGGENGVYTDSHALSNSHYPHDHPVQLATEHQNTTNSADQYDPTAVLNTLAASTSNGMQTDSLQCVTQLLTSPTAPETAELAQGSF